MPEVDDLEVLRSVLDGLHLGIYIVDRDRRIVFWNKGAENITGYISQEVIGRRCQDDLLVHCNHEGTTLCTLPACPLGECMRGGKDSEVNLFVRHRDGYRIPVHAQHLPLRDCRGAIIGAAEAFEVNSANERRRGESAQGMRESPAELGDRTYIEHRLHTNLARWNEFHVPFAILCVQIDHLSDMRARLSHGAENEVTRAVGNSLQNAIRETDYVGCWNENQFLIILSKCQPEAVEMVAERVKKVAGSSRVHWWGDRLEFTLSIGRAISEADDSIDSMVRRAAKSLTSK
ncbi:MAG TPA: PAS domain-containing protein [Terriglobales bacterium]|jgi:diguanylate cyclase (GGDEF)-like protein/PAS domain S-box-containing protein